MRHIWDKNLSNLNDYDCKNRAADWSEAMKKETLKSVEATLNATQTAPASCKSI